MSLLHRIFTSINKRHKALEESVRLEDYMQPESFSPTMMTTPYRYVVIDNFFKPEFVEELSVYFNNMLAKGLGTDHIDRSKFRFFDPKIKYDGYVYTVPLGAPAPLDMFQSVAWNLFFTKLFGKPTTFGTNVALHHHPPHDKTGWVHNDYATYVFPQKTVLPNGVYISSGELPKGVSVPSMPLIKNFKQKRTIALLYYFNNPEWKEGDGGETGIYSSKSKDSLTVSVAPVNNRLLAFDISPASFHAFQENMKDRNCLVQWFHADLDWCEKEYGFL